MSLVKVQHTHPIPRKYLELIQDVMVLGLCVMLFVTMGIKLVHLGQLMIRSTDFALVVGDILFILVLTAYMLPLLAVLDEYERYGVALVDKVHTLFTVFTGEIKEHHEALAPAEVRHIKTTGTDHIWSQKRFQRKADTHARWHLKHVAEMLDHMVDRYRFDRLVLAGPVEATGELYHLLSKRLRARVVERLTLPMEASEHAILAETLRIEQQVEQHFEQRLVEELIAADKPNHVTLGLESTVYALDEGRIWRLVYASGLSTRGGQCPNCAMLFARTAGACDYYGTVIEPVDDLVERMAEGVLESDGQVEEVAGDAAMRLQQAGRIGAVLRC